MGDHVLAYGATRARVGLLGPGRPGLRRFGIWGASLLLEMVGDSPARGGGGGAVFSQQPLNKIKRRR